MSLLGLQYFLVAAEELNFTAASKRLYITQQTLSAHILRLEKEYGIALFNRKPRLSLTPEGERMVKYATRIVRLERIMSAEFADLDQNARGVLSLGISRMRAKAFFHEIWSTYRKQFPNIEIHLREGNSDALETLVERHIVDMCIGIDLQPGKGLCRVNLFTEGIFIAIPKALFHAYYQSKSSEMIRSFSQGARFPQLPDLPLLLLSPVNRIRRIVDNRFDEIDTVVRPAFESNDLELLLNMCEHGAGQAFVPASSLFYSGSRGSWMDQIYAFPIQDANIQTILEYSSDLDLPHYAQQFVASCQRVFLQANKEIERKANNYLTFLQEANEHGCF